MSFSDVRHALGPEGPFAEKVPGYQPRAPQVAMALAVEQALKAKSQLLVEAGTGTGKTFAYLVPAVLSGQKTLVSTGTRNLQDQLFHRDLPQVRALLAKPIRTALLKGRSNYLCPYRLEQHIAEGELESKQVVHDLQRVAAWAGKTQLGDIAELIDIAEDSMVWPLVTSTADNCLGQECPKIDDCPLMKARESAAEADIIVVNHHLFFADKALKDRGFGELLPAVDAVIFDEAHQLPETAAMFFGQSLSSRQINDLLADTLREILAAGGDLRGANDLVSTIETRLAQFRLLLGEDSRKGIWADVCEQADMPAAIAAVNLGLSALLDSLAALKDRSKGLDSCHRRAEELGKAFEELTGTTPDNQVHWFETFRKGFVLQWTPLEVSQPFRALIDQEPMAWVFTSATLAVREDFRHIRQQLGLSDGIEAIQLPSPFAYEQQALFYVPRGLPDPGAMDYTRGVLQAAMPVLKASQGRAFFLFTSHRALREAAEWLPKQLDFTFLVQGTQPKAELLRRFASTEQCVLLATGAFWEGVDVRGQALSLVIIDKLPFASPADPVMAARLDAYKSRGQNPFVAYQLPSAIIAMKQGAGRLIRDVLDTGVLMVCDPRLVGRPYGQLFLQSLPPMRRTREATVVAEFFEFINALEPAQT
ncbi:ATP-dependent DNA helicase DinG [Paraperlucidibaca baekdonensis]|uniref:DNA 5'-3' helicase n=1 Tax=Paraperlucidibaca baekdonensis TaxID=748120 RepID=A0A3E0H502_9GAMM|nr:ATP-dependent DNA helicase [Paraperlucidibaca baekdonensis]REH37914.1 ATP-dependent DNA helicase DinG [Paraperlucidibaca baekdonensis]